MRYTDPKLRELLAAEYVLGTLQGRARERFCSLMRDDGALRREVTRWEARLVPLVETLSGREAPARAWAGIEARLGQQPQPLESTVERRPAAAGANPRKTIRAHPRWWNALPVWRGFALAMTVSTIALALVLSTGEPPPVSTAAGSSRTNQAGLGAAGPATPAMMAILTDATAQPTMLVSWPMAPGRDGQVELRVRIIMDHPTMDANTSWELWLLPSNAGGQPRSVGLVGVEPEQRLRVDASMLEALMDASGMALSNEPAGGSPTGRPSGPVIFKGPCIKA